MWLCHIEGATRARQPSTMHCFLVGTLEEPSWVAGGNPGNCSAGRTCRGAGMNKQEGVRKTAAGARSVKADTQLMGLEETRTMRGIAAVVQ